MKLYQIIILSLFLCTHAYNLNAQSIKGEIIDENKEPLSYINIVLQQANDSLFIGGTISNQKGKFTINNIQQGDYELIVSGIGYQTYHKNVQISDARDLNIGQIILKQESITLNEVIVAAKQNPLSIKQGKYTLNVSKTALKDQATTFDILSFLPGVISSSNGVSVMGKGKPLILLNGREIRSQSELEVLQPDQIKEVSVDTHPSAEYSSQYNSVIHITTISSIKDYVSSQIFHTSKFARKYSDREGVNINIAHKKWLHFISYQIKDYRSKDEANNMFKLYDTTTHNLISSNSSDNYAKGHSDIQNIIMSTSYKFNDSNNLNVQYTLDLDNDRNIVHTDENTLLDDQSIIHHTDQNIKDKSQLHNVEIQYVHKGKEGESFSLNGGYIYAKTNLKNLINTDKTQLNLIDGNNKYNVATIKADYKRNIFDDYRLQIGGKYVNTNNTGSSNSFNPSDGKFFYKNKTSLKDNSLAAYLTVDRQFKKLYASVGVRGEYFTSDYSQDEEKLYNKKNFTIYPSVNFEYTFTPNLVLVGGYENKSGRPSFSQLSPIIRYINAMLYEKGNPELKQMNLRNLYLSCVINRKFSVEASYTHKKNFSMYVFQPNPLVAGSLVNAPININVSYYTLSANYSDKWGIYRFAYNGSILYDVTKLPFLGDKDQTLRPRFFISTVNQFDVYKQTMLFCNFNITSRFNSLGTDMKSAYDLSIGVLRTFFKDNRLQVIVSVNDILHKAQPNSTTSINNVWSQKILDPDSRNVTISIRYNLNKFRNMFQQNKSNIEEKNRITN